MPCAGKGVCRGSSCRVLRCCSVLQCVALLQCVAVCCVVAVFCSVLRCCSVLPVLESVFVEAVSDETGVLKQDSTVNKTQ